jgi:hypothetical protein
MINIMDLNVGEVGVSPMGIRYRIIRDDIEMRPRLGRVVVRTAEDQDGCRHKFIRGIDVERADDQPVAFASAYREESK